MILGCESNHIYIIELLKLQNICRSNEYVTSLEQCALHFIFPLVKDIFKESTGLYKM